MPSCECVDCKHCSIEKLEIEFVEKYIATIDGLWCNKKDDMAFTKPIWCDDFELKGSD